MSIVIGCDCCDCDNLLFQYKYSICTMKRSHYHSCCSEDKPLMSLVSILSLSYLYSILFFGVNQRLTFRKYLNICGLNNQIFVAGTHLFLVTSTLLKSSSSDLNFVEKLPPLTLKTWQDETRSKISWSWRVESVFLQMICSYMQRFLEEKLGR